MILYIPLRPGACRYTRRSIDDFKATSIPFPIPLIYLIAPSPHPPCHQPFDGTRCIPYQSVVPRFCSCGACPLPHLPEVREMPAMSQKYTGSLKASVMLLHYFLGSSGFFRKLRKYMYCKNYAKGFRDVYVSF